MRDKLGFYSYGRFLCSFFISLFIITGCVYTNIEEIDNINYAPKEKKAEILLVEGDISRKYKPIAFLNIIGSLVTNRAQIDNRIKKEARKIGGDAVLFVTYSKEMVHYPMVTGVIVVYE